MCRFEPSLGYSHDDNKKVEFMQYALVTDCTDHEDNDVDLDKDFLQDLRDLKTLAEREHLDELRQ